MGELSDGLYRVYGLFEPLSRQKTQVSSGYGTFERSEEDRTEQWDTYWCKGRSLSCFRHLGPCIVYRSLKI